MRIRRMSAAIYLTLLGCLLGSQAWADITGALLPTSRSVQVGAMATAFATIVNTGTETATNCGLELGTSIPATFLYRTTDRFTNLPIEPLETTVDIPAGRSQSWVFGIVPSAPFGPTEVVIRMACSNTTPSPVYPGVNTLLLSASANPVPDVMALAATLANDGVARAPGFIGTGIFATAMSNVGVSGQLTAVPELVGTNNAQIFICETNTATGACLTWPPTATASFQSDAGTNRSFALFITAAGRTDFDPANTRAIVKFFDGAGVLRGSTSVAYETQTQMANDGGSLQFERTTVNLPENAAWAPVAVEVALTEQAPAPVPEGFGAVEQVREVIVSDEERLNAPVEMVLDYDPAAIGGADPMILRFDEGTGSYQPLTMFDLDTERHTVTIDSRVFSDLVTTVIDAVLPASYSVAGFTLPNDVWNIINFQSDFAGGNCLGMSSYAVWFAQARPSEALNGKYDATGGAPTSLAHLTATRAHLAQSQYWAVLQYDRTRQYGDAFTARAMKTLMYLWDQPLVLILGVEAGARHADVVYGWDETGFLIYEVNTNPGAIRSAKVPFANGIFGQYGNYTRFGFLAKSSLGRNEDFAALTADAEGGFAGSSSISLTSPAQAAEINDVKARITGTLTGDLASGRDVIAYLNSTQRITLGNNVNEFDREVPIKFGDNRLIVLAGDMSKQSLWYKNGATLVRTFKGTLAPFVFRSTLTWTKTGDVDLYVTEPRGGTSWYGGKITPNGLSLDFDNTSGFGPENITLSPERGDTVQEGLYRVRVHYYRGEGPVSGQVAVSTYEGQENQKSRTFNWTIQANGSSSTAGPGGTGPQWTEIADVDVVGNAIQPR
jgi:uncharacterized protein YfaP (DUF2135 family)